MNPATHCRDCRKAFKEVGKMEGRALCNPCYRNRLNKRYANTRDGRALTVNFSGAVLARRTEQIDKYAKCAEQQKDIEYERNYLNNIKA